MSQAIRVSASDFRQHFGRYMRLVENQDFEITRNGRVVARWTNPHRDGIELVDRLAGSIHGEVDLRVDRDERLANI